MIITAISNSISTIIIIITITVIAITYKSASSTPVRL